MRHRRHQTLILLAETTPSASLLQLDVPAGSAPTGTLLDSSPNIPVSDQYPASDPFRSANTWNAPDGRGTSPPTPADFGARTQRVPDNKGPAVPPAPPGGAEPTPPVAPPLWQPPRWMYNLLPPALKPDARSTLLPGLERDSLFPSPSVGGLLAPPLQSSQTSFGKDVDPRPPPFWSPRAWAAFSFDMYVRLVDRPRAMRIRLKQSLTVLPGVCLKPSLDLSPDPSWASPARVRLDIKAFGCMRWRLRPDAPPLLQLRARAPLADPRFMLDILYERNLAEHTDGVRVAFRALDWAFLKAPDLGAGLKIPISFLSGIKSTIRVKKFLVEDSAPRFGSDHPGPKASTLEYERTFERVPDAAQSAGWFGTQVPHPQTRAVRQVRPSRVSNSAVRRSQYPVPNKPAQERNRGWRLDGPIGVDIKLRLLQFGGAKSQSARHVTSESE